MAADIATVDSSAASATAALLESAGHLRSTADRLIRQAESIKAEAEEMGPGGKRTVLRGAMVTEQLAELVPVGEDNHYRQLAELLRGAGFVCAGKDSAASLLAALQRAPEFKRVRARSGRYRRIAA